MRFLQPSNATSTTVLPSLGEDAQILLDFKQHAGLPGDSDVTELDSLLKRLLLSAENLVDRITGRPYREREFTEKFRCLSGGEFYFLRLTRSPVSEPVVVVTNSDGNEVTYVESTNFELNNCLQPELIFPLDFSPENTTKVFPYVVTYTAGGEELPEQLVAIFQVAANYYRNPEAMSGSGDLDSVVMAHLDALGTSFL